MNVIEIQSKSLRVSIPIASISFIKWDSRINSIQVNMHGTNHSMDYENEIEGLVDYAKMLNKIEEFYNN